ncbi:MAG: acetylxylan esterase [Puniceicoccaceae bacterium]|nr:MAG: acetylxylan esterase [Puniceicoccaceae bacterium]
MTRPELIVEEAEVPAYELPDILSTPCGQAIQSVEDWEAIARPALLEKFETQIYGRTPRIPVWAVFNDSADDNPYDAPSADAMHMTAEEESTRVIFGGKAILRQARLNFRWKDRSAAFDVLLVSPARSTEPAPVLIGLNFWGNHTIDAETSIRMPPVIPDMETRERGSMARRWHLEDLIDRGYAVATAFRGEIVPESYTHFPDGVLSLFPENTGDEKMGAIGGWAWALSRIADYVTPIPEIDNSRMTVFGHSRLGKAALWAGAQDTRFSAVFANNSGCMGAALSRREFGETVAIITRNFDYWFSPQLPAYAERVNELPVDQHQLLALIAPRALHLGAAKEDLWADPYGEFIALHEAATVYSLYGIDAQLPEQMPQSTAEPTPVGGALRFHHREGKHDVLPSDWNAYLTPSSL